MGLMDRNSVYLDSNIVIELIENQDAAIRRFLATVDEQGGLVVTSELTLMEVSVVPFRKEDLELIALYESFLQSGEGVLVLPIDRMVLTRAAEIRAKFGNKTPDAIHVATAQTAGCEYLVSADKRLRISNRLKKLDMADLGSWSGFN